MVSKSSQKKKEIDDKVSNVFFTIPGDEIRAQAIAYYYRMRKE